MKRTLIVIDMQNDFIDGALGTKEAQAIMPNVKKKIEEYKVCGDEIIFTRDTHFENYLETQEGKKLPIIMYHSILRDPARAGEYIVSPQTVENDLIYLKQHDYTAITASELADNRSNWGF